LTQHLAARIKSPYLRAFSQPLTADVLNIGSTGNLPPFAEILLKLLTL
jgi:hypothetical protein